MDRGRASNSELRNCQTDFPHLLGPFWCPTAFASQNLQAPRKIKTAFCGAGMRRLWAPWDFFVKPLCSR